MNCSNIVTHGMEMGKGGVDIKRNKLMSTVYVVNYKVYVSRGKSLGRGVSRGHWKVRKETAQQT